MTDPTPIRKDMAKIADDFRRIAIQKNAAFVRPDDPGTTPGTPPYDPDRGLRLLERIIYVIACLGGVAMSLAVWRWWL